MGNNDDKILTTCLSLCKNNSQLPVDNLQTEGKSIVLLINAVIYFKCDLLLQENQKNYTEMLYY